VRLPLAREQRRQSAWVWQGPPTWPESRRGCSCDAKLVRACLLLCQTACLLWQIADVTGRWALRLKHAPPGRPGERLDLDAERRVRTRAEMAAEAAALRRRFQ